LQQLLNGIGGLLLLAVLATAVFASEPVVASSDLSALRRESFSDTHLVFAATLWTRLTLRDWIVTLAVLAFTGLNFFLWSLPISQMQLFFITAPLGMVALVVFMWFAPRS
jgi:hypothetical protein